MASRKYANKTAILSKGSKASASGATKRAAASSGQEQVLNSKITKLVKLHIISDQCQQRHCARCRAATVSERAKCDKPSDFSHIKKIHLMGDWCRQGNCRRCREKQRSGQDKVTETKDPGFSHVRRIHLVNDLCRQGYCERCCAKQKAQHQHQVEAALDPYGIWTHHVRKSTPDALAESRPRPGRNVYPDFAYGAAGLGSMDEKLTTCFDDDETEQVGDIKPLLRSTTEKR